jgi:hypothetical protein
MLLVVVHQSRQGNWHGQGGKMPCALRILHFTMRNANANAKAKAKMMGGIFIYK